MDDCPHGVEGNKGLFTVDTKAMRQVIGVIIDQNSIGMNLIGVNEGVGKRGPKPQHLIRNKQVFLGACWVSPHSAAACKGYFGKWLVQIQERSDITNVSG